ncbi:Fic family protein [Microbacterium sp. 11MF]|uniref:Fic family protein n=1 Tax=Microbacterium sp. 11MF TaxID=1169146 RepID=UPI001E381198|nr:Fic family protein [Microbacterium sp. 11MF]
MLLGEAESKCEHLAGAALTPEIAAELHKVFLTKGIHGTTSIEGNTLSEDEVRRRIDGELELSKSREYLGAEIDNILAICNDLADEMRLGGDFSLSVARIKEFNRRILDGQPLREGVIPGRTRTDSVVVGLSGYRGAPAEDAEYLLDQMVDWLNQLQAPDDQPEMRFPIAVMKAILAHLYIAWIHPFGDGNGRTARMIEFQLMIEAGVPSPAAHLLSNHYNLTRDVYLIELDKTSRMPGYPIEGFVRYAVQGLVDQLREQIQIVRQQQLSVTWVNYVHDMFRDEDTPAKRRQMHLVLDMPPGEVVTRAKLPEVSARVLREYANKESKTISRDINGLLNRRLIVRSGRGFRANRELIEAFLPIRLQ